jgi:hypothetical protein
VHRVGETNVWRRFAATVKLLYVRLRNAIEAAYSKRFVTPRHVFSKIYERNAWHGTESISGPGSSLSQTVALRCELPKILHELGVRSLLDAPCGDFNWMRATDLGLERYMGVDVVPEVIRSNQQYATAQRTFACLDIIRDALPTADAILCRDCLVHLPNRSVVACIRNFKRSGAKYLVTTTFPGPRRTVRTAKGIDVPKNRNIVMGGWRPIDFEKPPFCFPPPLKVIFEEPSGDGQNTKALGVWELPRLRI